MRTAPQSEVPEMFPGLPLQDGERVLLSGYAKKRLYNPLRPGPKHREGFVLSDRRLIMLTRPRVAHTGSTVSNFTSMPLRKIDAVQILDVRWSFLSIVVFLLLLLFYIVPGLIYLVYMSSRVGLWLAVHSGGCSNECRLARSAAPTLAEFTTMVDLYAQARSS